MDNSLHKPIFCLCSTEKNWNNSKRGDVPAAWERLNNTRCFYGSLFQPFQRLLLLPLFGFLSDKGRLSGVAVQGGGDADFCFTLPTDFFIHFSEHFRPGGRSKTSLYKMLCHGRIIEGRGKDKSAVLAQVQAQIGLKREKMAHIMLLTPVR